MAGNKKQTRSKAKKNTTAPTALVSSITNAFNARNRITQPAECYAKAHMVAVEALNRIIDQTGNFRDWTGVMVRLYLGAVASDEYFSPNPYVNWAFNQATTAMQLVMVRTHSTGKFGITSEEVDSVTRALALTDEHMRLMRPQEMMQTHKLVEAHLDEMIKQNKVFYPKEAPATIQQAA